MQLLWVSAGSGIIGEPHLLTIGVDTAWIRGVPLTAYTAMTKGSPWVVPSWERLTHQLQSA